MIRVKEFSVIFTKNKVWILEKETNFNSIFFSKMFEIGIPDWARTNMIRIKEFSARYIKNVFILGTKKLF